MADEVGNTQQVADGRPPPHCGDITGNGNNPSAGGMTPITIESVRKLLAPFSGSCSAATSAGNNGDSNNSQQNDPEYFAVPLRQVPVSPREVPKNRLRGEVMDWIVQHVDDEKLPHFLAWKIASICADNLYRDTTSDSQQINALNDAAKRELEKVCRELESNSALLEDCLCGVVDGASPYSPSGISVRALRNARRVMEDRHVIVPDLNAISPSLKLSSVRYEYYAVFDGHGGRDAANFGAAHLHMAIAELLAQGCEPADAIKKAFIETDSNYCDRPNDAARRAGSTAVVALICDRRTLHIGWLGDSEAVLARVGTAQPLVVPHKPSLQSEQTRIKELGGDVHVVHGIHRVNGNLAVSRSIGDMDHKPFVSCEAEVNSHELDSECDFLVLGCDGLFDNLTSQDVVSHAYHAALSLQFNTTRVADHLTQAAVSKGSSDNITTLVVNLRDPKKWQYEAVVFPSQASHPAPPSCPAAGPQGEQLTERLEAVPADVSNQQFPIRLNGNNVADSTEHAEISNVASLTGGDASPVREVAADFVHSAVEMALNKVNNNGAPGGLELTSCDLSPPEGEQRDLIATLKNETPESERLNPDAPEFVPFGAGVPPAESASVPAVKIPDLAAATPESPAVSTSATETMSKSESRDELVFEVDRQLSIAPQPAKAELVEIEDHTASSPLAAPADVPPTPSGGTESGDAPGDRQLSDSEEEPNSMVVHEDQPQVNIVPAVNMDVKLSELIIRGQDIHVIPEESPSDEAVPPTPEVILTSQTTPEPALVPPAPDVLIADNPTENVPAAATIVDTAPLDAAEMQQIADFVGGYTSELGPDAGFAEVTKEGASVVDAAPAVFAEVSAQLIQGDLLNLIEASSAQPETACASARCPVIEAQITPATDYLFMVQGGVHEEAIIPRAQPLLFDDTEPQQEQQQEHQETADQPAEQSTDSLNHALMGTMTIDEGPKVVDAIEKDPGKVLTPTTSAVSKPIEESAPEKPQEPVEASVEMAPPSVESSEPDEAVSKQPDSLKLGSIQDIMEKLSPSDAEEAKTEEAEPHSAAPLIPDSIPEAECVQDADSESDNEVQEWEFVKVGEPPKSAAQESVPAALETSLAAASVTAAGVAVAAGAIAVGVISAAESKPAPAKAVPKVGVKASTKPPATSKATASTRMAGSATAKTSGTAAAVSKAAPKAPAATKASTAAKTTATTAVKGAPTRPASSTTAKPAAASKVTPAAGTKTTSATSKPVAPTATGASAPKPAAARTAANSSAAPTKAAAVKPSTTASKPTSATRPASTTTNSAKAPAARPATSRVTSSATSAKPTATPASKPVAGAVKAPAAPKVASTRTAASTAAAKPQPGGGIRAPPPTTKPAAAATGVTSTAAKKPPASSAATAGAASRVAAARNAAASRPAPKSASAAAGHGPAPTDSKPKSTVAGKTSSGSNTKTGSAPLPKSPVKKAVKQEEPKKKVTPVSADAAADVVEQPKAPATESQHQGHNGETVADSQSSVSPSQTNGHSDQVDLPAEQAPQNPVEQH